MADKTQAFVKEVHHTVKGDRVVTKVPIYTLDNGANGFFWASGMAVDADGAPNAYHPDGHSGLDYTANAGEPGNWYGIVTDDGKKTGKPVVQGEGDPCTGFYVAATSLHDPNCERQNPRRYVDSATVPFFVLPPPLSANFNVQLGDLGVVINGKNRQRSSAIFGDVGPAMSLGEGSVALATALGLNPSARDGGTEAPHIVFIVFPGSAAAPPWPRDAADLDAAACALFDAWGGMDQFDLCFPEYK